MTMTLGQQLWFKRAMLKEQQKTILECGRGKVDKSSVIKNLREFRELVNDKNRNGKYKRL